jgi:hypothetical protein
VHILAPFDDETQALLHKVDSACASQVENVKEELNKASLSNGEYQVDLETLVWMEIIKAYGVLMNRAIDAGWVKGIHTDKKI